MDAPLKKSKTKEEPRVLLRTCFKNPLYAFVPYDIWKTLIFAQVEDLKTLGVVAQLSHGCKSAIEELRRNNMTLAKHYRKENQIPMAHKCLLSSVECKNPEALVEYACALQDGGWGVGPRNVNFDEKLYRRLVKEAAEQGYPRGMFEYGRAIQNLYGFSIKGISVVTTLYEVKEEADKWYRKAFDSGDALVLGLCHFDTVPLEPIIDSPPARIKALYYFRKASKVDSYASYMAGRTRETLDYDESMSWFMKAAQEGYMGAQDRLAWYYRNTYAPGNPELALFWSKRVKNQQNIK